MFLITPDQSVVSTDGRLIFFSLKRFISDIVQGSCCFICGASPDAVPFNDEHVLPDWILRRFKLHDRVITLPNGTKFRYGQFKIPCCEECNRMMGDTFERPIHGLFENGHKSVGEYLKRHGAWLLFSWMCLIFLKTHLKDKQLRLHLDARKGEGSIGDNYTWEELHHVHCVARAFFTRCDLKKEVLGSLLVVPVKVLPYFESFDYGDLSFAQTVLLRIDDVAIITVIDDSQASISAAYETVQKIKGPLSPLQVRELAVRLAINNIHLAERTRFKSEINMLAEECSIVAQRPSEEIRFDEFKDEIVGQMMAHLCGPLLGNQDRDGKILEMLRTGHYGFLFDERGEFRTDDMDPVNSDDPEHQVALPMKQPGATR
jgi:hypothetical protein